MLHPPTTRIHSRLASCALPLLLGLVLWLATSPHRAAAQRPDPLFGTRALSPTVTYTGTNLGGTACATSYTSSGREPTSGGARPLFLYFVGMWGDPSDSAAQAVIETMAQRGYAAVSVKYDNQLNVDYMNVHNKAACIFDPNRASSLVGQLCARTTKINCALGITTWGHSQGAGIAAVAGSYDARVRASFLTGFGNTINRAWVRSLWLGRDRIRLVNGLNDDFIGSAFVVGVNNELTGSSCSASPCLMGGGAGWLIVGDNEVTDGRADHCWLKQDNNCVAAPDAWWAAPWTATQSPPFEHSMERSATWLNLNAPAGPQPARFMNIDFASLPEFSFGSRVQFQGVYPWGVIDWTAPSNFFVYGGAADGTGIGTEARHAAVSQSTAPATGRFSFYGPQGRMLVSMTLYTTQACAVTIRATRVNGAADKVDARTIQPGYTTIPISSASDTVIARNVTLTSQCGNRVKLASMLVAGTAPAKTTP